jgi:formate dehydrogenase iron-sulfur subunit
MSTTPTTPTTLTLYVPRDSAALAVGADAVADALRALAAASGTALTLVRNGSRGLLWLEVLLEVATPQGRVAYGPVTAEDVPTLWPALLADAAGQAPNPPQHPLRQGLTEQIPYLALQERLTFARIGVTDPLSLDDYAAHEGWAGLKAAVAQDSAAILQAVTHSGLRGRGGAAFPAGIKWKTVAGAAGPVKYVVCNADEGDSGTFADRMVMEGDPYLLIEGMAIAALAVGARRVSSTCAPSTRRRWRC